MNDLATQTKSIINYLSVHKLIDPTEIANLNIIENSADMFKVFTIFGSLPVWEVILTYGDGMIYVEIGDHVCTSCPVLRTAADTERAVRETMIISIAKQIDILKYRQPN